MHGVHEVAGSSPVTPTASAIELTKADTNRAIAQLVARVVRDHEAVGSSPTSSTKK